MNPTDAEKLEAAKKMVLDVLEGRTSHENDPGLFEDDVLWMSVRRLEKRDPQWLVQRLGDSRFDRRARLCVAKEMTVAGQRSVSAVFKA